MSKSELIQAYLKGRIAKRTFIRALIALGVSVSSASAYASMLTPAKSDPGAPLGQSVVAGAPSSADFYFN